MGKRALCFAVVSLLGFSFFAASLKISPTVKADLNSEWQSDFVWLVTGSPAPDDAMRQILETLRFTYTTLDVTADRVVLSDFVVGGQPKYYGIIFQDYYGVGDYLDASEIQAISDAVSVYGLNLSVVMPWKASVRNLLGIASVSAGVNPYSAEWPVDFATNPLLLSFSSLF